MRHAKHGLIYNLDKYFIGCLGLSFFLGLLTPFIFSEKLRGILPTIELMHFVAYGMLFLFWFVSVIWLRSCISKLKKMNENEI